MQFYKFLYDCIKSNKNTKKITKSHNFLEDCVKAVKTIIFSLEKAYVQKSLEFFFKFQKM